MYNILKEKGLSEGEILEILKRKSRDNSRTPVQWNSTEHAGFTTGTPWIDVASNYIEINAENAVNDPDSVFYHYQKLISLRKEYDIITEYELLLQDDQQIFVYVRSTPKEKLLVINNFYEEPTTFELPKHINVDGFSRKQLLSNYTDTVDHFEKMELRPYESVVYYLSRD
jgi:trehalose-6-phosphate hydrolase